MISEPTKLSKNDLAQITYHEDNVIPKDIKKTRKSKKTAKSKPSIIEEHFARRMEARTRTPTDTRVTIGSAEERAREPTRARTPREYDGLANEPMCENPDCRSISTVGGLCADCHQATVMTRRTPSRR